MIILPESMSNNLGMCFKKFTFNSCFLLPKRSSLGLINSSDDKSKNDKPKSTCSGFMSNYK